MGNPSEEGRRRPLTLGIMRTSQSSLSISSLSSLFRLQRSRHNKQTPTVLIRWPALSKWPAENLLVPSSPLFGPRLDIESLTSKGGLDRLVLDFRLARSVI